MYLMKVWIDQDLCTGDGLCEEIAPDVFVGLDDGLFYVKEGDKVYAEENGNVGGAEGVAAVPKGQEDDEVPEAIIFPFTNTEIRLAIEKTTSILCSISKIGTSSLI